MSNTEQPRNAAALPTSAAAVVGFLVFTEFASGFAQGFYNPLVAAIAKTMNVTAADINWFNTLFTLSAAVAVPLLSKLGDKYGHRRMLRFGVVTVFVASLLIAFAPSYPLLLLGRILIGPLAVWLPLEIALIHNRITGEAARRAISFIVAVLAAGSVVGALAAGGVSALTSNLTVALLVPSVVILGAVYAVFFKVPESTTRTKGSIDYPGFLGLAVVIIGLLWGLGQAAKSGFTSPAVLVPIAVSLVVFIVWVAWQKKAESPAINLKLVTSRSLGPIYVAAFLFGFILFGDQVPLATFLASDPKAVGYGFAMTATSISAFVAAATAMATIGSAVSASIARRITVHGLLIAASIVGAVAYILLSFIHQTVWQTALFVLVSWLVLGIIAGVIPSLIAELSPPDSTGIASGIYNTLRTIGGAVAGAGVSVVLSVFVNTATSVPTESGYTTVWLASGLAFALAAVFVAASTRRSAPAATAQSIPAELPMDTVPEVSK